MCRCLAVKTLQALAMDLESRLEVLQSGMEILMVQEMDCQELPEMEFQGIELGAVTPARGLVLVRQKGLRRSVFDPFHNYLRFR